MKRLLSILICSIITFTAQANKFTGIEPLDSTSYTIGYQCTASLLMEDTGLMRNKNDYEEYVRGLEDNILDYAFYADSSYVMSYSVGGMLGVFITDGHSNKDDLALFRYVIEGLRKASEERLVLPADTIEAMAVLERHGRKDKNLSDTDEKAKREFFTAYGIMKAFQPGIQEYINELKPGTSVILNRQAYAKGMADALEACVNGEPKSAYELGKTISFPAKTILMGHKDLTTQSFHSFIAGAKAALDLGEQLIAKKVLEEMLKKDRAQDAGGVNDCYNIEDSEKWEAYQNALNMEMCEQYAVNWDVTVSHVASDTVSAADDFGNLLMKSDMEGKKYEGILLAQTLDEDGNLYESILSAIKNIPLAEGYKWFCGRNYDNEQLVVGIMETSAQFKAKAIEASVALEIPLTGNTQNKFIMPWKFDSKGTAAWSLFTDANIGKFVAIEINGMFVNAPRIMNQITAGTSSAYGLFPEKVNQLFTGATMIVTDKATDEIEAAEVE